MTVENERQQRGLAALAAITGGTGTAVVESLKDIAPDLTIGGASLDQMLSELDASDVQPLAE